MQGYNSKLILKTILPPLPNTSGLSGIGFPLIAKKQRNEGINVLDPFMTPNGYKMRSNKSM